MVFITVGTNGFSFKVDLLRTVSWSLNSMTKAVTSPNQSHLNESDTQPTRFEFHRSSVCRKRSHPLRYCPALEGATRISHYFSQHPLSDGVIYYAPHKTSQSTTDRVQYRLHHSHILSHVCQIATQANSALCAVPSSLRTQISIHMFCRSSWLEPQSRSIPLFLPGESSSKENTRQALALGAVGTMVPKL